MKGNKNTAGFTLIELMIVVVIIGILASVAIPQFQRYVLRSKTTESARNIGAIRTSLEAFAGKWNVYAQARPHPVGTPGPDQMPWLGTSAGGFDLIAFRPGGNVYYQYAIGPWDTSKLSNANECDLDESDAPVDSIFAPTLTYIAVQNSVGFSSSDVIMIFARGDLDGDDVFTCFVMSNNARDILPVPPTAGTLTF